MRMKLFVSVLSVALTIMWGIRMPFSSKAMKKETIDWIKENIHTSSRVLDVGAGMGTYSDLLTPEGYENIDCVEIFEPYIIKYKLHTKYTKVWEDNVTEFLLWYMYDLVIMGDVLEHLSIDDSKRIIQEIKDNCKALVVAVPYTYPQGEHYGNKYEAHIQDDLTREIFEERYKGLTFLGEQDGIGVWVWLK